MLSSRGWERGRPALITQRAARIRARRTLRYWLEGQTATRGCACPTEQVQGQLTAFRLTTTSGNQMNRTGMGCLLENCAVPSEGPRRTLDGYLHGDLRGEIYSIRSQRRRAMGFRSDGSGTQVGRSPAVGARYPLRLNRVLRLVPVPGGQGRTQCQSLVHPETGAVP